MSRSWMRSALAFIGLVGALAPSSLGQGDQELLKEKLEKKLAEPFLKNGKWYTDYDVAREEAKKNGKLIFAYFTRSYAP